MSDSCTGTGTAHTRAMNCIMICTWGIVVQEIPNAAWQLHTYITYSTGGTPGAAGNEVLTYGPPKA